MIRVQFQVFDKDSSANYGETVCGEIYLDFQMEWAEFKKRIPFKRWYAEHEILNLEEIDITDEFEELIRELDY